MLTWFAGELQTTEWRRNQARPQPSVAATKAFGTWHQADTFLAFQYFNPRYSFNLFDLTFDFLQSLYSLSSTMQLHLLQHGLSVASIIISERSENRDKVGTKIYLVIYIENSRTICQSWNVKSFKMSLVVHMGIDTNKGLISHPSWWGFCQTLSGGGGAFGTGAGQEFPLLLSVMNLLSFHPCCACNCSSCRADLLYETQDNFQHRSLALACFSSQPLTWHHVGTPQNSLSSRLGQRHHSAREELQHQCFTSSLNAGRCTTTY